MQTSITSALRFGTTASTFPTGSGTQGSHSRAFTLIEILTVVAIIAVLAALLIPVAGKMQDSANRAKSASNLRQLAAALLAYSGEHSGNIPGIDSPLASAGGEENRWVLCLVPYLGAGDIGTNFSNRPGVPVYWCPADKEPRDPSWRKSLYLSYGLNLGLNQLAWHSSRADLHGGRYNKKTFELENPAKTIMFAEIPSGGNPDAVYSKWCPYVNHPGGKSGPIAKFWDDPATHYEECRVTLAFYDGHVEFLKLKDTFGPGGTVTNPKGMWTPNAQD